MTADILALWQWLPIGYVLTVLVETPVLAAGLSAAHRARTRMLAAAWLTGVTYPVVAIVLPVLLWPRVSYPIYVLVAEAFAIVTEVGLFRWRWRGTRRDLAVVALANLLSATVGMVLLRVW